MGDDADGKVKRPVELTKKQELNNHVSKIANQVNPFWCFFVILIYKYLQDFDSIILDRIDEKSCSDSTGAHY